MAKEKKDEKGTTAQESAGNPVSDLVITIVVADPNTGEKWSKKVAARPQSLSDIQVTCRDFLADLSPQMSLPLDGGREGQGIARASH